MHINMGTIVETHGSQGLVYHVARDQAYPICHNLVAIVFAEMSYWGLNAWTASQSTRRRRGSTLAFGTPSICLSLFLFLRTYVTKYRMEVGSWQWCVQGR